MKRKSVIIIGIAALAVLFVGFYAYQDIYFKINKNIDIFGRVYKEIVSNYVDEVDPERFMRSGIDGMLETLDPYTVFIGDKNEGEEIDLITHGQYGGVGISIGVRDGVITVIYAMEGYSAHKQGIIPGDRIIEIDGKKVTGMNPDSVRSRVRGEPGTVVKITIERDGESHPLEFSLVREEIQINNVTFTGFVKDGIGIIKLDRFSRRAGEEVRLAIKELKSRGDVKGIVLDLRDNPGGLLEAAVEIVSKFAPKGSTIVSTRGRKDDEEKVYTVTEDPIAADIPLAVLVNKGSASASEIVAGALQDLDRAVVVGERSFGKGLVQTVIPLSYNTSVKITTARYYTPSGRCIQEIDYLHKNKDGVFLTTPDSMKHEFKTLHGRLVKDLGGIMPDTIVKEADRSSFIAELLRKAMFFKFATHYAAQHSKPDQEIAVNKEVIDEFENYLKEQKFDFKDDAEKNLAALEESLKKEKYSSTALSSADALSALLKTEKQKIFSQHTKDVRHELEEELNARYFGEKARFKASLAYDDPATVAAGILSSKSLYNNILRLGR